MKHFKKIAICFALSLSLIAPSSLPILNSTISVVEAASPKLSASKLTLEVGKSKTLTLKNTKKTPTWKSSKKSVATVNKNGKVTAKAPGTTTITATLSGTKYTCKVTVKKAANPALKDAPFKAMEFNYGNMNMVVPFAWTSKLKGIDTNAESLMIFPNDDELSYVQIAPVIVDDKTTYKQLITAVTDYTSADFFAANVLENLGVSATILDYEIVDSKTKAFPYRRISYTANIPDMNTSFHQSMYLFLIDDYFVTIDVFDQENNYKTSPLIQDVEYILTSIRSNK